MKGPSGVFRTGLCSRADDACSQALELNAHVRRGEKGSPVVLANSITRHADTGESLSAISLHEGLHGL
jgi:antirestriction protein ArdC